MRYIVTYYDTYMRIIIRNVANESFRVLDYLFICVYIYLYIIYIFIRFYVKIIFFFFLFLSSFLINIAEFCKPLTKLDLPTLRQSGRKGKNATEQPKTQTLDRIRTQAHDLSRRCSTH